MRILLLGLLGVFFVLVTVSSIYAGELNSVEGLLIRGVSGTSDSATFTKTLSNGIYIWNYLAYDDFSGLDWGDANWTVNVNIINAPPTIPTTLLCNGQLCTNNETFSDNIGISCSGSIDPEDDNITYVIDAYYNHTDTIEDSINAFNNSLETENLSFSGEELLITERFDNGLTNEILIFTAGGDQMRYLQLPRYADVKSSNLQISGYPPDLVWEENSTIVSGISPETFILDNQYRLIVGFQGGSINGYTWNGNAWITDSAVISGISIPGGSNHSHVSPTIFRIGDTVNLIIGFQGGTLDGYTWTGSTWTVNNTLVSGLTTITDSFPRPEGFYMGSTLYLIVPKWTGGGVSPFIYDGYTWSGNGWTSNSAITSGLSGETIKISVFHVDPEIYMIRGTGNSGGNPTGKRWSGATWVSDTEIVSGMTSTGSRYNALTVFNFSLSNFAAVVMDEGSQTKGFHLQIEEGPTNPYLEVGTPDGNFEWNVAGIFDGIDITTLDLSSTLNMALNSGACDCVGCTLNVDNCTIPFLFHSDSVGKLEYDNIFVEYDPDSTDVENVKRFLRIPRTANVTSAYT